MTRTTVSILAALLLGGASVALAQTAPGTTTPGATETPGAAAGATTPMTEAEIEQKLTAEGYTEISDIEMVGDKYEARAMKDGVSVQVEIDPATGLVTEKEG